MKLEGQYLFKGPREEVWKLVRDPEVLATALPGAQDLQRISNTEYRGTMSVRIGPVSGAFSGCVLVSNEVPPLSYTLAVEGQGKPGWAKGSGKVELVEQSDCTTLMTYTGEVQIGGKLAGVGQRLIDSVSKSLIRQGLEVLNKALEARIAVQTCAEGVQFKPPSEAQFAAKVAKDMLSQAFRKKGE
jgi:carbon monoxide dehydrogenase subunit G